VFHKVLIANRGEIAVRVIRSLRELGVKSVAVYSDADRNALHVRLADEAYHVGPTPSAESYLKIDKILEVAQRSGAEAIHPGYGFLSERAEFAEAVAAAGLTFIGPSPEAIRIMGDKMEARSKMMAAGVPVVPGTEDPIGDPKEAAKAAKDVGFPLMLKAAAGGGGKGMRKVDEPAAFQNAFDAATREAQSSFGDGRVYMERYVTQPRHVEVQVFGDTHGNIIHLMERECSIQRRHQKVIEESPSPFITQATRDKITAAAVDAAAAVDYVGAGTVEFLVDADQNFYFLEMNTRLQVEHPVTEMVTGYDLVRLQLEAAAGNPLPVAQNEVTQTGHAIEARIYAEDPEQNFMPSPGTIKYLRVPDGPGVRDDTGIYEGAEISIAYDPMISKLVVWGSTRQEAIRRMQRALHEYRVLGLKTNIGFHQALLARDDFQNADFDTGFLDRIDVLADVTHDPQRQRIALAAAAIIGAQAGTATQIEPNAKNQTSQWRLWARRAALQGAIR